MSEAKRFVRIVANGTKLSLPTPVGKRLVGVELTDTCNKVEPVNIKFNLISLRKLYNVNLIFRAQRFHVGNGVKFYSYRGLCPAVDYDSLYLTVDRIMNIYLTLGNATFSVFSSVKTPMMK